MLTLSNILAHCALYCCVQLCHIIILKAVVSNSEFGTKTIKYLLLVTFPSSFFLTVVIVRFFFLITDPSIVIREAKLPLAIVLLLYFIVFLALRRVYLFLAWRAQRKKTSFFPKLRAVSDKSRYNAQVVWYSFYYIRILYYRLTMGLYSVDAPAGYYIELVFAVLIVTCMLSLQYLGSFSFKVVACVTAVLLILNYNYVTVYVMYKDLATILLDNDKLLANPGVSNGCEHIILSGLYYRSLSHARIFVKAKGMTDAEADYLVLKFKPAIDERIRKLS